MTLKLVIGNKNYSSWSMRPWLAMRASNIAFEEIFIPLYTDDPADKERILGFTRSGKVPALIDGDITVWDSLADHRIRRRAFSGSEAVAGGSRGARACAFDLGRDAFGLHAAAQRMRHEPASAGPRDRAVGGCARQHRARSSRSGASAASATASPGRSCSARSARADAMFAPVVHRFRTYAIEVAPEAQAYMDTMMAMPAFAGMDPGGPCRDARDREVRDGLSVRRDYDAACAA